ncbi:eCIS core domain-containing protein [Streptomyces sp. IBSBF 2435]|uniref:eCIS core domain-containing protein n=1 Tax=Streptomyces sp. IBSBF 2435 TaxID=2903531 RepID=UPI002FDC10D5
MRHTTEPHRNSGTDREQAKPRGAARSSGPGMAAAGRGGPLHAGALGALQGSIGNAAVARMVEREQTGESAGQRGVQRSAGAGAVRPDAVREAARSAGRGGSRLPGGVRRTMESAFGGPLDHVRVAVDEQAAAGINATAYTVGDTIVVRSPNVLRDVETMAHEIHHTTQHDAPAGLSDPGSRWEREASDAGARVARGQKVQRCADDGEEHDDGVQRAALQRRVGFEFESQWRVRDHSDLTDEDEQRYQNEVSRRDDALGGQILLTMARHQFADLLDRTELARPPEELRDEWLTAQPPGSPARFAATDAGRARLARARQDKPAEYARHKEEATLPLLGNGEIRETPIRGRDVPKMGTVGGGTGYRLTSDVSPTGGSALEWVTDPLTTRDELLHVMGEITQVSGAMDARKGQESFPLQEVGLGGFTGNAGIMVFPQGGEIIYAPQMTGGFKLDELPRLLEYLDVPAERPRLTLPSAFEQRKEAKADLHQDGLREADGIRREAESQAGQLGREITGGASTDALVGLATLVGSYVAYGARLPAKANSKSIAGGLMSRTSFAHNFMLLPHPLRLHYRAHPDRFAAFVLTAAGFDPADRQALLYPNTVEHGDAGERAERAIPLTRWKWLVGMPAGKDLLRNYRHLTEVEKAEVTEEDWTHIHPSLGALGSVDDRVGARGRDEVALVAELRRMKDSLRTADLTPLAVAAFDLVQRLNEGRTIKYEKKGR